MVISIARWHRVLKWTQVGAVAIVTLLLGATLGFLYFERTWAEQQELGPEEAFLYGTIGTELAPLPALLVLPDLFPEHFQPAGPEAGDWIDQFGFLRTDDPRARGLPVGFVVTNYRPKSAAPSPVEFVGFSCVLCHSTEIRAEGSQETHFVIGPGNVSLNLFAWADALQAAILDEDRLTLKSIVETYEAKTGERLSAMEKLFVGLWLRQIRTTIQRAVPRFDEPFGHGESLTPEAVPTGPGRTQPFRTIIRRFLNLPGTNMSVYTKISSIYQQGLKAWAQVDGSVSDLRTRSSSAALAAGATADNLAHPEIVHNVIASTSHTVTLRGPSYSDLFPDEARAIDPERVTRGQQVFMAHCDSCHGHPNAETGAWIRGEHQGEVVPHQDIGTDPERVVFRHNERIAEAIYELFPEDHPFSFPKEVLRTTGGYINGPIDSAFSRAPYLHNASVLTLAELINLKPRRTLFYRGRNLYDPRDLGYQSPDTPNTDVYFPFDTSLRGNSNRGHDYPWPYRDEGWNEQDLLDLLEYLKTV